MFLRAVNLFDEIVILTLNVSDKPIVIDTILLDQSEEEVDDNLTNHTLCSSLVADAPPKERPCNQNGCRIFSYSYKDFKIVP